MNTYKTALGLLKHLSHLAKNQDMRDCADWAKLTEEEQKMFYSIIAGIQNDLGEMQRYFDERKSGIEIYRG